MYPIKWPVSVCFVLFFEVHMQLSYFILDTILFLSIIVTVAVKFQNLKAPYNYHWYDPVPYL